MTGIDDDLDTIRGIIKCPNQDAPMHTRTGCTFCGSVGPAVGPAVDALARVEAEIFRLREALDLIATKPFTAAMDAREMQNIARAACATDEGDGREPNGYRLDGGRMIPTDR